MSALLRIMAIVLFPLLLAGGLMFWNSYADRAVSRHDAAAARNVDTGILLGAEPRTLGPETGEKAVLFVHGFVGSPNNFADLPDHVAGLGWHVRVMLLPGHGTYPGEFEKTSADELEAGVVQELEALQARFSTVVLLGHSMGGALATIVAAERHPDGLVLVSPYYSVTRKWYYLLRPETWAGLLSPLIRWIYRPQGIQPVNQVEEREHILSYNWIPTKGALTAILLAARARSDRLVDKITMPTLLIHSKLDTVTDPAFSEAIYNRIPSDDKRVVWLELSDHIVFWDYDRNRVKAEVTAFLEKWSS